MSWTTDRIQVQVSLEQSVPFVPRCFATITILAQTIIVMTKGNALTWTMALALVQMLSTGHALILLSIARKTSLVFVTSTPRAIHSVGMLMFIARILICVKQVLTAVLTRDAQRRAAVRKGACKSVIQLSGFVLSGFRLERNKNFRMIHLRENSGKTN